MNDLINRQDAMDALVKAIREDPYYDSNEAINGLGVCDVRVILNDLPSAQPERKKGKWNAYYHGINEIPSFTYSCNQCGYSAPYGLYGGKYSQKKWNFCPACGADMRGEKE